MCSYIRVHQLPQGTPLRLHYTGSRKGTESPSGTNVQRSCLMGTTELAVWLPLEILGTRAWNREWAMPAVLFPTSPQEARQLNICEASSKHWNVTKKTVQRHRTAEHRIERESELLWLRSLQTLGKLKVVQLSLSCHHSKRLLNHWLDTSARTHNSQETYW